MVGTGRAGLWVLLAAALDPGELTVAADLDRFDASDDEAYVNGPLHSRPAAGLAISGRWAPLVSRGGLLLHNVRPGFPLSWFETSFEAAGRPGNLRIDEERVSADALVALAGALISPCRLELLVGACPEGRLRSTAAPIPITTRSSIGLVIGARGRERAPGGREDESSISGRRRLH